MPNKSKPIKRRPLYKSKLLAPANGLTPDDLHATPIVTAPFELHDDGSILLNKHAPEVEQIKTPPPALTFSDPAHQLWLYHGNSLELLDAIADKYPKAGSTPSLPTRPISFRMAASVVTPAKW